ncbi:MAG: TMEM175 family protein [Ginsengibacter sp.]
MDSNSSVINQHKETARIEAFSDGIFCVAITLLAIEIGVEVNKDETNEGLLHTLISKWRICLAYFISFVNVLLAWIGHHGLFKNLKSTDNFVMMTNGLLIMLVALAPFPTKTLGLFIQTGAFKTAVVFYTGYFVLISIAFRLLWYAASRKKDLLIHGITEIQIKAITKNENIGLVCNSIIMAVAFVSPWTALVLSFLMWVYWIVFA